MSDCCSARRLNPDHAGECLHLSPTTGKVGRVGPDVTTIDGRFFAHEGCRTFHCREDVLLHVRRARNVGTGRRRFRAGRSNDRACSQDEHDAANDEKSCIHDLSCVDGLCEMYRNLTPVSYRAVSRRYSRPNISSMTRLVLAADSPVDGLVPLPRRSLTTASIRCC